MPQTDPSAADPVKDSVRDALVELVELHDSGMAVSLPHGLNLSDARKVAANAQGKSEETQGFAPEDDTNAEVTQQDSASGAPAASEGCVQHHSQPREANAQKLGSDDTDAEQARKATASKSHLDSVVIDVESLPSAAAVTRARGRGRPRKESVPSAAAATSARGRGRPRKQAACQDSTDQTIKAKRIWGKSALSRVLKKASSQISHSQIWPEHTQRSLAALSSDPISDSDDILPPPVDDGAPKKDERTGRTPGTAQCGLRILPCETAKPVVQATFGREFKADPDSPLFSMGGVAVSRDNQLNKDAYFPFKGHFQSEPLDRKDHVNPLLPGMRSSEVASLRTGLKMWCDTKGAGWIAKKPDGKKSAWFSIKTWKSWRLAYLIAKLQRDLWWQESDSKNGTLDHKPSRSSSSPALPKDPAKAAEDATAAPEALTPKRPRSRQSDVFSSPKSVRLSSGPENFVTPVKEKKRPIPNSSQSDQPPLKIQLTHVKGQQAPAVVARRRFRSKTSVAAQSQQSCSLGNSEKTTVPVTGSAAGSSAAANRSASSKAQKQLSIARCSRDPPDCDLPPRQRPFMSKKGPRPKPVPPPGCESDVEDIATGITGMEAYASQPNPTEEGRAKVAAATDVAAQKHGSASRTAGAGVQQDWQDLVWDALDFQAGHAPWLADLLAGKSEDEVSLFVGKLRQAGKDAMANEILRVFEEGQMDID